MGEEKKFDGLIITGAPVEMMEFEDVEYWDELCQIMEWSKTTSIPPSTISAGAHRAGLLTIYGIQKFPMEKEAVRHL